MAKLLSTFPLPELEPILAATYGRILFQDQVLDVVRIVGDLSPDEADQYQKAITHARSPEGNGTAWTGVCTSGASIRALQRKRSHGSGNRSRASANMDSPMGTR